MYDFEVEFPQFVKELGPASANYTPTELRQLQIEVHKMAEFLLECFWREKRQIQEAATKGIRIEPFFTKGSVQPELRTPKIEPSKSLQMGLDV